MFLSSSDDCERDRVLHPNSRDVPVTSVATSSDGILADCQYWRIITATFSYYSILHIIAKVGLPGPRDGAQRVAVPRLHHSPDAELEHSGRADPAVVPPADTGGRLFGRRVRADGHLLRRGLRLRNLRR
jgi:hypothetical protein